MQLSGNALLTPSAVWRRAIGCQKRYQGAPLRGAFNTQRPKPVRRSGARTTVAALPEGLGAGVAAGALSGYPPAALAAAAGATVLGGAVILWQISQQNSRSTGEASSLPQLDTGSANRGPDRENAVLVFGSSGKLGRLIVEQLIKSGRPVVAAARSAERARAAFRELGLQEGVPRQSGHGPLFIEGGVDVTDAETLTPALLEGVTQVVSALGPVFGRTPEGGMGYLDNMTSERVDAGGVSNIAALLKEALPHQEPRQETVLSLADDLHVWERLDDVIMGGQSDSSLVAREGGGGAVWAGEVRVEGGGFCGARTRPLDLDLSPYDGISLRVKGDGQTYKLNLKTADQEQTPESTFQAQFDTVADTWTTVQLPWREFVAVKRARYDAAAAPLDPSKVCQFGLVLSRFEYNGFPNQNFRPGRFELELEGGISAFSEPRPQVVLVSSAGVERNAVIGDDEAARKADIPIVQLNPGGTLNHKYTAENAVRASGLPYTVLRATGLTNEDAEVPFLLEASQGDRISGKISRGEVAQLVAAALASTPAAGKTVELRRSEAADARGKAPSAADRERLFLAAALDRQRAARLLPPFPAPAPPPPPPSQARTEEILSDERVKAAREAGRGGRVRSEEEAKQAGSVTLVPDGRKEASAPAPAQPAAESAPSEAAVAAQAAEAGKWVSDWRERTGAGAVKVAPAPAADTFAGREPVAEKAAEAVAAVAAGKAPLAPAPAKKSGFRWPWQQPEPQPEQSHAEGSAAADNGARAWIDAWRGKQGQPEAGEGYQETGDEVASARRWIRDWRARTLEARLPQEVSAK